ncbi:hypothetical protein ACFLXQ_05000 [Chloroflexota bacterium]
MRAQKFTIILICILILIGLVLIFIKAVDLLGYEGQLVNRYNNVSTETVEIKGDFTIGQTFLAPENDLHRIDVLFRTYGRRNTHEVTFYLKPSLDSPDIITQETFNASEVGDNRWHTFEFPPIPDSAGKMFYFYFASPESVLGDAITVGGGEGDFYNGGGAFAFSMPANADLAFRTFYGLSPNEKLSTLGKRLIEDKPSIWGDVRFYILLVMLYILIMGRILAEMIRSVVAKK